MKLHLKHDLGLNKATIKKHVDEYFSYLPKQELDERGYTKAKRLLDRRTQFYTPEESKFLAGYYCTSHDECVVDNTGFGEFSAIEEYQANAKYERMLDAIAIAESYLKTA